MGSMRIDASHCILYRLSLQRNNGERASKGPCQAGFSQSFYSILVSRDVLQDRRILKGRNPPQVPNWPVGLFSVSLSTLNGALRATGGGDDSSSLCPGG